MFVLKIIKLLENDVINTLELWMCFLMPQIPRRYKKYFLIGLNFINYLYFIENIKFSRAIHIT